MQQETDINFYGPFKAVLQRNLAKIAMTCYAKEITMFLGVGTLPDGYVRTTHYHKFPLSRVSRQAAYAYHLTSDFL
jgi:hypothetical protein